MLHCDLRVRWNVASDLRFRAAISEPKTPSFCGISGDLAPSMRKSLAIAIVRLWCAKVPWPSNPCSFGKSKVFFPQKTRVLLFAEPLKSLEKRGKTRKRARENRKTKKARRSQKSKDPKILGKEGKTHKKAREIGENEKSKEIEKSKDPKKEGQGRLK